MSTDPGHTTVPESYSVLIRSGRHAGAVVTLGPGHYVLGRADDADIVLTDDGVAENHAALHLRNGSCSLHPMGGPVLVGGRAINAGARGLVPLPAELSLGTVDLALSMAGTRSGGAVSTSTRSRRLVLLAGVVALVAGAVAAAAPAGRALGSLQGSGGEPTGTAALLRAGLSLTGLTEAAPPRVETASVDAVAETGAVAKALSARLKDAGLAGLVHVQPAAGVVEARGAVRPENERDWTGTLAWFDQTYGGRVTLVSQVRVEEGAAAIPKFAVQSIWAGKDPYVIASDGEKYGVGARLSGGWVIEAIGRDGLVVSRQGDRVSLVP